MTACAAVVASRRASSAKAVRRGVREVKRMAGRILRRAAIRLSYLPREPRLNDKCSGSPELLVEFLSAEEQRRGPPVRTVVTVLGHFAQVQQVRDLFGRELVAGLHRGL